MDPTEPREDGPQHVAPEGAMAIDWAKEADALQAEVVRLTSKRRLKGHDLLCSMNTTLDAACDCYPTDDAATFLVRDLRRRIADLEADLTEIRAMTTEPTTENLIAAAIRFAHETANEMITARSWTRPADPDDKDDRDPTKMFAVSLEKAEAHALLAIAKIRALRLASETRAEGGALE